MKKCLGQVKEFCGNETSLEYVKMKICLNANVLLFFSSIEFDFVFKKVSKDKMVYGHTFCPPCKTENF